MATQQRNVYSDNAYAELQRVRELAEQAQAALKELQEKEAKRRMLFRRLPAALAQAAIALTTLTMAAIYVAQWGGWPAGVAWGVGAPIVGAILSILAQPDNE